MVIDPFMGSGTTIVEAIVNQRVAIGTDINEIAYLVAKVKTTPLLSLVLLQTFLEMEVVLKNRTNGQKSFYKEKAFAHFNFHERIDYWYKPKQKEDLAIILHYILQIENQDIRDFFLVTFTQILKTCSIWLQKSIKPTRDLQKKDYDVVTTFLQQAKKMIKKNDTFIQKFSKETIYNIDLHRKIVCQDARTLPCEAGKAALVVTSPPYVTSYEYADLHQLPLYWLGYLDELTHFRKKFIGSSATTRSKTDLKSLIAHQIVKQLGENKKGREVHNYFADMYEIFNELYRVLKPDGKACIVIGNTQFKGVDILNAEVFVEQMQHIGFQVFDVIKREIPSKMLPSTRDSETGQFAKTSDINLTLAYPTEYILIMKK